MTLVSRQRCFISLSPTLIKSQDAHEKVGLRSRKKQKFALRQGTNWTLVFICPLSYLTIVSFQILNWKLCRSILIELSNWVRSGLSYVERCTEIVLLFYFFTLLFTLYTLKAVNLSFVYMSKRQYIYDLAI